jgi:hypothetical protein
MFLASMNAAEYCRWRHDHYDFQVLVPAGLLRCACCSKCAAIVPDDDEVLQRHAEWHTRQEFHTHISKDA